MNAWYSINAADSNACTDDVSNIDKDFALILDDPNDRCLILEERGKPVGMVICYIRPSLSSGNKIVIEELEIDH